MGLYLYFYTHKNKNHKNKLLKYYNTINHIKCCNYATDCCYYAAAAPFTLHNIGYTNKLWGVLMKGTPSRTQQGSVSVSHLIQSDNQNKGGFIYKPKQIRL